MKNSHILILCFLFVSVSLFGSQKDSIFVQLSAIQCDSLINANQSNPYFAILDVRTSSEYEPEHLKYAVNIDFYDTNFDAIIGGLNKDKVYLIHCLSGGRSGQVFEKMRNMNFSQVYNMIGGINAWNAQGLPVTSSIDPILSSFQSLNIAFNDRDSIELTITNSGNGNISFSSITDLTETSFSTNFNENKIIAGAREYAFEIYYHPTIEGEDSINLIIESNGGTLVYKISGNAITSNAHQLLSAKYSVFPNPVLNQVFSVKGLSENSEIQIFDYKGSVVRIFKNEDSNLFNLENIPSGIYILQVLSNKTTYSTKLIVQ